MRKKEIVGVIALLVTVIILILMIYYSEKLAHSEEVFLESLKELQVQTSNLSDERLYSQSLEKLEEHIKKNKKELFQIRSFALVLFTILIFYFLRVLVETSKEYEFLEKEYKTLKNLKIIGESISQEDAKSNSIKISELFVNIENLLMIPPTYRVEDFVDEIGKVVEKIVECDRFSIAFVDSDGFVIAETAYAPQIEKIHLKPNFKQHISETSLRFLNAKNTYRIIPDLEDPRYKNSVSTKLLLKEGIKSSLTVPLFRDGILFAFLFVSSKKKNAYTEFCGKQMVLVSNIISKNLFYSYVIQSTLSVMAASFVNLVEFKDNETGYHVKRVALYSKLLAEEYSKNVEFLPSSKIREIYNFSPLHDIGKVGVPDRILLKPEKLDPDEWEIMKKHVDIGGNVIKEAEYVIKNVTGEALLSTAYNIVIDHHEKYDGTGYPKGKRGAEISIEGRITALADVFDALTTKRPYKKPFPFDEAVDIIKKSSGTHFDPVIVEIFLNNISKVREIYERYKE